MIYLSLALKTDRITQVLNRLSAGAGDPTLLIYSGTQPAGGDPITDQVLLASFTLAKPVGTVSGKDLTLSAAADVLGLADDVGTWGRFLDGDGTWVIDMDAGDNLSSAPIKLNPQQIYTGGTVKLVSGTLSEP